MRKQMLGTLAIVALVVLTTANLGVSESAYDVTGPAGPGGSRELITHVSSNAGEPQVVTIIDPASRVLGVYHVDPTTGEIALRSVRNISWDLQMVEFNSAKPLPQDIRSGLHR